MLESPFLRSPQMRVADMRPIAIEQNSVYSSLRDANTILASHNAALMAEHARAGAIQKSFLPDVEPSISGYDFAASCLPAREAGGDFLDYIAFADRPDTLGLVIADVSDKGLPAAFYSSLTHGLIRSEAGHDQSFAPREVLMRVNSHLRDISSSEMFVTLLYSKLDAKSGKIAYARAGHEYPVLLDHEGNIIETEKREGQPLGLFDKPQLDCGELEIPKGGMLVLFSDGVTEETNHENQIFTYGRFVDLLRQNRYLAARDLANLVMGSLDEFGNGTAPYDDRTLMIVKRTGRGNGVVYP